MIPTHQDSRTQVVQLITYHQRLLYAYIRTLVSDPGRAEDVLQETNLALWQKTWKSSTLESFAPYAMRVARNKAVDHVRREKKLGGLVFDTELSEKIAARMCDGSEHITQRMTALETCVEKLPDDARKLLSKRYSGRKSVRELASESEVSETTLQNRFARLRGILRECVERTLTQGETV